MASNSKTYQDFLEMAMSQLKDFLTVRGISVSGYSKVELVARAFSAAEMGMLIILSSEEQALRLEAGYQKILFDFNLHDPKTTPNEDKKDDLSSWPSTTLGNIFEFILSVRDFNVEYIGKYKDQKAYSYFGSNFVGEILVHQPNKNISLLFCKVTASMSIHDEKELWIAAQPDGKILTAWCSCMAGASRCCNHIIAALYKVEYANNNGFTSPSCTSVPFRWNQFTKNVVEPKKISDIVVRKKIRSKIPDNSGDDVRREEIRMGELNSFDPRQTLHRTMTDERLTNLLKNIAKSNSGAVLFKSVEGMSIPSSAKLSVSGIVNDIIRNDPKSSNEDKITILLRRLCFSAKDVDSIEKMTRGQVDTASWMEHRKGRLTASQHHEYYTKVNTIAHVKGALYPKVTPLVANIIYRQNNLEKVEAVKWGKDHEKEALKAFYAHEATKHDQFKFESAGLWTRIELT